MKTQQLRTNSGWLLKARLFNAISGLDVNRVISFPRKYMGMTATLSMIPSWSPSRNKKRTPQLLSVLPASIVVLTTRPPNCQSGGKLLQRRDATSTGNTDTTDRTSLEVTALAMEVPRCVIPSNFLLAISPTLHKTARYCLQYNNKMRALN